MNPEQERRAAARATIEKNRAAMEHSEAAIAALRAAQAQIARIEAILDEFDALDYRKQKAVSQHEFSKMIREALEG